MEVSLYHYRNCKAFEASLKKNSIKFEFLGFGCGYYDPYYNVESLPELKGSIAKNVWIEIEHKAIPYLEWKNN